MKRFFVIVFMLVFLRVVNAQEMSSLQEPYCSVHLMPFNNGGWYLNAEPIAALVLKYKVKTIVEIGSWMGLSTRHMATLIPEDGKVFAVDTWEGSPNEQHDPEILCTLYDQFLSNVIHTGLTHKIIPIRMTSLLASQTLKVNPDLIYLDATHTYDAVYNDLCAWFPHVKGRGVFCGDDWAWGDHGVEQAVLRFAHENHLKVQTNGWFWYLEE